MDVLTWAETAPLGEALSHSSPAVRLAALRALVRLPLETEIWLELREYVLDLLRRPPDGDTFASQTIRGIPYAEILKAAVYIPTQSVRERLYQLLVGTDEDVRTATAQFLAEARDPAALDQLVEALTVDGGENTQEIAELLSLLYVSRRAGEISEAFSRSSDPDACLWLAIALARAGTIKPLEQVLRDLDTGKIDLRSTWGDPEVFLHKLRARRPLPAEVRARLLHIAEEVSADSWAGQIASTLGNGADDLEKAVDATTPGAPLEADQALQSSVDKVTHLLQEGGDLTDELVVDALQPGLLRSVPPDLAGFLVSALFNFESAKGMSGHGGNAIVEAIYDSLQAPAIPDIPGLFRAYDSIWETEDLDRLRPVAWGLRWQIAWALSRASLQTILAGLAGPLQTGTERELLLAARLIEDATRTSGQAYPPIFGGGEEPGDQIPSSELIDDSGYGGGWSAGNGGGARREGRETGSIPGEDTGRGAAGEGTKALDEPPGRGGGDQEPGRTRGILEPETDFGLKDFEFEEDSAAPGDAAAGGGDPAKDVIAPETAPNRERRVNTGFSTGGLPVKDLEKNVPLKTGEVYYFWVSIGQRDVASLETGPSPDVRVPVEARLTVALFSFADGLILTPGADIGELRERGGRSMEPVSQPLGDKAPQSDRADERLFFPVTAPVNPGEYRMRCNLYWGQILLQSRLVEVLVEAEPTARGEAEVVLRVTPDYTIAPSLDPAHLRRLPEHRLSILMNQNQDGTHSFHFLGAENGRKFKNDDIRFGESELQDLITTARKKLRRVSWGTEQEWDPENDQYLYKDRKIRLDRLTADLINLAQWGYPFYERLSQEVAGRGLNDEELQELMKKPGIVQIALKESPSYILPVSLIYDYNLDVGANLTLCPAFIATLENGQALESSPCFQGECPSRGDLKIVCPSGFWGFRHYLGTPLTVVDSLDPVGPGEANGNPSDVPPTIEVQGALRVAAGVATNLEFTATHIEKIRQLRAGTVLDYADTRDRVFEVLKGTPHLVYFYCHGGYVGSAPYLQVGADNSQVIDPSNIKAYRIHWDNPRPLVFINGCHTTSVAPLQALQFISPFVTRARSAGVIGTEITIFEELATTFAEACLSRFYAGESIGAAIRNARLVLLQEGNPLGLVYIPFVMAGLRLVNHT